MIKTLKINDFSVWHGLAPSGFAIIAPVEGYPELCPFRYISAPQQVLSWLTRFVEYYFLTGKPLNRVPVDAVNDPSPSNRNPILSVVLKYLLSTFRDPFCASGRA